MMTGKGRLAGAIVAASLSFGGLQTVSREGPSSVIVVAQPGRSASAESSVRSAGGEVETRLPIVGGFSAIVPGGASRLLGLPGIASVFPDREVVLAAPPSKPGGSTTSSTQTNAVGAPKAWSAGYSGRVGVNVAVLDSGVSPVPDLTSPTNRIVGWKDLVSGSATPVDPHGHGTYVAGLIAGNGAASAGKWKGVAPGAGVVGVRVFDALGAAPVSRVVAGIQWVIDNRAAHSIRVLNLSLTANPELSYRTDPLAYAAERAWLSGIVVVTSAGNQGPLPGTVMSPGIDPFVITVGSAAHRGTTSKTDDEMVASSGAGPTTFDGNAKPDVAAPGEWNVSLRSPGSTMDLRYATSTIDDRYVEGAGTSGATAVVSGVTALMLHRRGSLSPDQVKHALIATAGAAPAAVWRNGAPYVDAYAAVMSKLTSKANQGLTRSTGGGTLSSLSIGDVKMR